MSRKSQTVSGLARESDAESSQQPSLPLPVQDGAHASNNAENIVPSGESQLLHRSAREFGNSSRESIISGQPEKKPSILLARWRCPPKIILNADWRVAAGEESTEVWTQRLREARLNRFKYLHPSAIPPSPPLSPDLEEGEFVDDEDIPVIPLEPVDDDFFPDEEAPSSTHGVSNSMASNSIAALTGSYADVGAAASAAFTALMRSYEQGNLIDTDLLIKLLKEPKMIELLKNIAPLADAHSTQPFLNTPSRVTRNPVNENLIDIELLMKLLKDPMTVELLTGILNNPGFTQPPFNTPPCVTTNPNMASLSVPSFPAPRPPASSTAIFARPPLTYPQMPIPTHPASLPAESSSSVMAPPPVKDISYLKSLIRQHGVQRPEVEGPRSILKTSSFSSNPLSIREPQNPLRLPEGNKKPCMYFGTPRGCRLGLRCPFRHESPHQQLQSGSVSGASGSKRVKLSKHSGNGH